MSITDRIAEVLGAHGWDEHRLACGCGRGEEKSFDYTEAEWADHVAAVLVETLGLTQVYSVGMVDGAGDPTDWLGHDDPDWQTARNRGLCGDQFVVTRYVTRWERTDG